ncbi:DUF4867 family protein [Lacticaseibacillus daqingensis]|uniref:DUF4867 family protein n=1 Tax=Lacticaseibacillus daqingensis TaxID=2486014 RepID=UPI000F797AF8|nr:DUF4867 family protein [Lacticaseibacillus daqingensis]
MNQLEQLRQLNPDRQIRTLDEPEFARFGLVYAQYPLHELDQFMATISIPAGANVYTPTNPAMERLPIIQTIGADVFAGLPIEAGECAGHSTALTAVEYHQGSELNIFSTPVVMVLGKRSQMHAGQFNAAQDAQLFYVPAGTVVEFFSDTLHYSPCEVTTAGFKFVVMLLRGSNQPLPADFHSDNSLIVKQNKFQVVHASRTDKIAQGAQVGVIGELVRITPLQEVEA